MIRQAIRKRFTIVFLVLTLSCFMAGRALAWQFNGSYGGVWPTKSWSPVQGTLHADIARDSSGKRLTQPYVYTISWNQQAIDWMRANSGDVAVTFHSSYDGNTGPTGGCSNTWSVYVWSSTNLPGSWFNWYQRNCGYYWPNEGRIYADKNRLIRNTGYYAQGWFYDNSGSSMTRGQFNVDTYWVNSSGNANFHTKYCVTDFSMIAITC